MGELLGIGITHAPMFQFLDSEMTNIFKRGISRHGVPESWKDEKQWPAAIREEWGSDEGLTSARKHREIVVEGFRRARKQLDEFNPDFLIIFGDDQYENFQEDIIPTFCMYMFDELLAQPYLPSGAARSPMNVWGLAPETEVKLRGNLPAAAALARGLIIDGFDLAWSTKPLHHPTLGHAFMRTIAYLNYDLKGFDYPVIPFHLNSYGSDVANRVRTFIDNPSMGEAPPAPSPARCFALGRAVGELIRASDWRVAVIGSSSWSHGFLTEKNLRLYPDLETDRQRLRQLQDSRHREWADLTLAEIRDAGEHEFLNWICMAGAMADAQAEVVAYADTHIFNSTKVVAILKDDAA